MAQAKFVTEQTHTLITPKGVKLDGFRVESRWEGFEKWTNVDGQMVVVKTARPKGSFFDAIFNEQAADTVNIIEASPAIAMHFIEVSGATAATPQAAHERDDSPPDWHPV